MFLGCSQNGADRYDLVKGTGSVGEGHFFQDIAAYGDTLIGIAGDGIFRVNILSGEEERIDGIINDVRFSAMEEDKLWLMDDKSIRSFRMGDTLSENTQIFLPDTEEIVSFDVLDGHLLTADAHACFRYDGTAWERFEPTLTDNERITEVKWIDDKSAAVTVSSTTDGLFLYRFELKKRKLIPLSERECSAADANESALTMMSGSMLYAVGKNGVEQIGRLRPPTGAKNPKKLFVSGGTVLVLWDSGTAILYRCPGGDETLTILTNDVEYERALVMSSSAHEIPCKVIQFNMLEFFDKINAKMLAQDNDYDLILLGTQPDAVASTLESIIRYGQYVDLYENSALKENLDAMIPGAKEILETDGKLAALPVEYGCMIPGIDLDAAQALGIEVPVRSEAEPFTFDYLWQIADSMSTQREYSLLSTGTGGLRPMSWLFMLNSALLAKYDFTEPLPEEIRGDITAFFERLDRYRSAGILMGDKPLFVSLLQLQIFDMPETLKDSPNILPISFPTASSDEKTTIRTSVVMVMNPHSSRRDLAFQFLTEITSEENRYNTQIFTTPFWPDMTRYYWGKSSDKAVRTQYAEFGERMEEILGNYFSHCRRNSTGSTLDTWNLMNEFCAGNISAEEAAEEFYKQLTYKNLG